jgi:phospholipase C
VSDCQYGALAHPIAHQACRYDASDIPFAYYAQFADSSHIVDYAQLAQDVAGNALPSFAYVKAVTTRNEHPNVSTISDGVAFVEGVIQTIEQSPYASSTLILVTWDEGGGFFDHVAPPPSIDTDDANAPVPYGTRVPLLAIGPFARKGAISHVTMEHSSIVRFLEYNFVGPVGQLGYNDAKVHNIGSLLDPNATAVHVPE